MSLASPTTETYTGDVLALIRSAQLSRTCIVSLLSEPNIKDIVSGAFVRVLLELENGLEDYRIGIIRGTEEGSPYGGFTHDHSITTTTYLVLDLTGALQGINGCSFQLNSVSNSPVTEMEWAAWARSTANHIPITEVGKKAADIRPFLDRVAAQRRARPVPGPGVAQQGLATVSNFQQAPHVSPTKNLVEPLGVTRRRGQEDHSEPQSEEALQEGLHRQVLDELREHNQLFPKDFANTKTSLLRILERDVMDYLDRVRDAMKSRMSNCVVCMDRHPTVISLPCKHKVLCRLCATVVKCCPVCRESVVELFEPVEI